MFLLSKCYVCGESPAKECTGCHHIAYCTKNCQRIDWPFHKHSCKNKTNNVIDHLIGTGAFDNLVKKIFIYLNGKELHAVRSVKRSWRNIIISMWESKTDRRLLEHKLEYQWTLNRPRARMLYEGPGMPAERIVHSNQELFLGCPDKNCIYVLDMDDMYKVTYISRWQTRVKHTIPKPNLSFVNGNVWDVHEKFVIVLAEDAKIKCWNRVSLKEMIIYDESALLQVGCGFTDRHAIGKFGRRDTAEKIFVFVDIVLVHYLSGLILKFSVSVSPAKIDPRSKIVTFSLLHRFECLLGMSPIDLDQIRLSHGPVKGYPEGCTRVYSKLYTESDDEEDEEYFDGGEDECGEAGVWVLEDDERLVAMDGVEEIYDLRRIGEDDYCLLSRSYDSLDEYDLDLHGHGGGGGDGSTVSDIFFPTKYLELWKNDECLRTFKVKGLQDAKLNDYCVIVLSHPGLFAPVCLVRFNLTEFKEGLIRSMDLVPTAVMRMAKMPHTLFMTINQIMWSVPFEGVLQDENGKDGFNGTDEEEEVEKFCVNSLNFWYAPHCQPPETQYPSAKHLSMCTLD